MSDNAPPPEIPQVRDYRQRILGLLPKNAQARLMAGVAVLMVLVMMFSGQKTPKPVTPSVPASNVIDPNQARIQEYRQRLDDETRRLGMEEAQLTKTKQELGVSPGVGPGGASGALQASGLNTSESTRFNETRSVEKSDLLAEQAKREYQSLFASNVALSYRPPFEAESAAANPVPADAVRSVRAPSRSDRVMPTGTSPKERILYEGTILETVLTNRLDSSFSGPVNCMVTTNVYSPEGPTLVIPQGTRVLGEARKLESLGQQRLAVVFHRLIRPDGSSISLDQFQGLSQVGETGLKDLVNNHYLQIFSASIAIGAIAGLAQANTQYGATESASDAYRQGVASSLSQSSLHILDRYLNVLPTFTIREGQRIKVYLSQDLRLSPYDDYRDVAHN